MAKPLWEPAVGMTLRFKPEWAIREYGPTAEITEISESISRPWGTVTMWLGLVTAKGTLLKWSLAETRGRLAPMKGGT